MSAAHDLATRQNLPTRYGPIPEWYEGHSEEALDREVYHRGEPLGFTVRDVLPARRWAIDPQGNTLSESEYKERYMRWYRLQLAMENQGPITEDLNIVPIQRIEDFVNKEPDHDGKLKPIGQDERPGEFRVRQRYAHTGQTMEEYERERADEVERRRKEKEREVQARQLTQLHRSGVLDDATYARQMESLYEVPTLGAEPPEAPASDAAPADEEKTAEAPEADSEPPMKQARCGYKVKKSPHFHEMRCEECKRLKAEDAGAEARA